MTTHIEVKFTIAVDEQAWCLEYGIEPEELEADVKEHVAGSAADHFRSLGLALGIVR